MRKNTMINRVEVIQEFPGYKVGDVLELNPLGNFDFVGNVEDNGIDAFSIIESVLVVAKPVLSKRDIAAYLGVYFKDTTDYAMKSKEAITKRINELNHWLNEYKDDGVALTVWQNLVWELEWVLGKRNIGDTK